MSTAEIAILISIISAVVAAISLGWNIYRDVILKAKVVINFGIRTLIIPGVDENTDYVIITATNHGPGIVNLSMVQMKNSSLWKRITRSTKHAVVIHDYQNPLSGQLPSKIEVGEKIDILFPYDGECLLKEGMSHVGLSDSFGRIHWASVKQVSEALTKYKRDHVHT